jgi:hypothetical protein
MGRLATDYGCQGLLRLGTVNAPALLPGTRLGNKGCRAAASQVRIRTIFDAKEWRFPVRDGSWMKGAEMPQWRKNILYGGFVYMG